MDKTNFKQLEKDVTGMAAARSSWSSLHLLALGLLEDDYFFSKKIQLKTKNASGIGLSLSLSPRPPLMDT
jgi:hypothetical protein